MALNLQHQTAAEFAARYWTRVLEAYQQGDKIRYCHLLYWLIKNINNGNVTDAQARATFNAAYNRALTAGQWATLKTNRITPAYDRYAAMLAEGAL